MRSSQHKNDLAVPTNSAIGPSPAVQRRAATSKNLITCTLPSDVISHDLIHHRVSHSAAVCQAPLCSLQCTSLRYDECLNVRTRCVRSVTGPTRRSHHRRLITHVTFTSHLQTHVTSSLSSLFCNVSSLTNWCTKNTHVTDICLHLFSLSHRLFKAPQARTQPVCVGSLNAQRSQHQSKTQRIWADTDASESEDLAWYYPRHWSELMQITRCAAVCADYSRFLLFICRSLVWTRRSRWGESGRESPPSVWGFKGYPDTVSKLKNS